MSLLARASGHRRAADRPSSASWADTQPCARPEALTPPSQASPPTSLGASEEAAVVVKGQGGRNKGGTERGRRREHGGKGRGAGQGCTVSEGVHRGSKKAFRKSGTGEKSARHRMAPAQLQTRLL
eukprot:308115-Rhodomonas_salina.4